MSVKQPTSCNLPPRRFKQDTDVNDNQHNVGWDNETDVAKDNTTSVI